MLSHLKTYMLTHTHTTQTTHRHTHTHTHIHARAHTNYIRIQKYIHKYVPPQQCGGSCPKSSRKHAMQRELSKSSIKHEKKLRKTTKHEEMKLTRTRPAKETELHWMMPRNAETREKKNDPPGSFSRNTEKHTYIILWQNPQKDRNSQPSTLFLPSLPLPSRYPDILLSSGS